VSAEVFGKYHIKEQYKSKVIPKSEEVKLKIQQRISNAFMFMSLDEHDLRVVIDAMDQKKVTKGDTII
jgi:cAMP-dependent protein kinase regulator